MKHNAYMPNSITSTETPTTSLQRVEIQGEPVSPGSSADMRSAAQRTPDFIELAERVARLEAHRLEVDAWIATLQAQSRDTAQTGADRRSAEQRSLAQSTSDMRSDAQDYAEPTWDDPEDAKAVPFNLSLPRGLKQWLDGEAKRTGLPASRLVQRWILAQRNGKGAPDA